MNDRSILNEPTMKTQSESAITIIEDRNGKLASLKTVYASMLEESELQGEAAAAIKQQMFDYSTIIEAAIEANRCDVEDHQKLIGILGDYRYVGADILRYQQDALDAKRDDAAERDRYWNLYYDTTCFRIISEIHYYERYRHYCNEVEDDEEEYQKWKTKENEFNGKEMQCSGLFISGNSIRSSFYDALDVMPLNFVGGEYDMTRISNGAWRDRVADSIRQRWYQQINGRRYYNVDAIIEVMSRNPEDIGYYEYMALCEAFDELTVEQRELLIESAYIDTDCFYYDSTNAMSINGNWKYNISKTFQVFTAYYGNVYFNPQDPSNLSQSEIKQLNNFNILYTFSFLYPSLYVAGTHSLIVGDNKYRPDIEITSDGSPSFPDLRIHVNAAGTAYEENSMHAIHPSISELDITIHSFRKNLDGVIDEASIAQIQGLKVDTDLLVTTDVLGILKGIVVGCVEEAAKIPFGIGLLISVGEDIYSTVMDYEDAVDTNTTCDRVIANLKCGNALTAFGVGGTVIQDQNGNYHITAIYYDRNNVLRQIEQYNNTHPGANLNFDPDVIVHDIIYNGQYSSNDQIEDFIEWVNDR